MVMKIVNIFLKMESALNVYGTAAKVTISKGYQKHLKTINKSIKLQKEQPYDKGYVRLPRQDGWGSSIEWLVHGVRRAKRGRFGL